MSAQRESTSTSFPIVSNQLLRDLASGDPMWATGQISAEDQAILCMTLQDISVELLAYRLTEKAQHPMRRLLLALQRTSRALHSRPVRAPIAGDL